MIRLAIRCRPELAENVLADLSVLAPNGVEQEEGPGYVEYAIYGAEGELPDLGAVRAAAGEGLVEIDTTEIPDDWADRWRDFHRGVEVGGRIRVRPSWEDASWRRGLTDIVIDPGQAFGTGAHATTRMCLQLLLALADRGATKGGLTDLGVGSGVLAIAGAKLGWDPVAGFDHEQAAVDAAGANAAANHVNVALARINLRERLPVLHETVVSNLTARLLTEIAGRIEPKSAPQRLVVSGVLAEESGKIADAFAARGFGLSDRREEGDWTAMLLERG